MENLERMIGSIKWTSTEYVSPHQYFRRDQNPEVFDHLCRLVSTEGRYEDFKGVKYKYFHFGEWKYWHFQIILNRAKISL